MTFLQRRRLPVRWSGPSTAVLVSAGARRSLSVRSRAQTQLPGQAGAHRVALCRRRRRRRHRAGIVTENGSAKSSASVSSSRTCLVPAASAAARAVLSSLADGLCAGAFSATVPQSSVSLFKEFEIQSGDRFRTGVQHGLFRFHLRHQAGSPYRTLADFIKAAKEKPGRAQCRHHQCRLSTQISRRNLFKSTAGVDVTIVPFRSSPDVLIALLRGDIQMAIENYTAVQSHISQTEGR